MARLKLISDNAVYAAIRALLIAGGDKAVSFSSVAQATKLAAPTLVQRYGARDAMIRAALNAAWDDVEAATTTAEAAAPNTAKGAQSLLKDLAIAVAETGAPGLLAADFRDAALRDRAAAWRRQIEAALAERLGGGSSGHESAAILFAAWQGQMLWQPAGGKAFRLKDAVKRLSD